MIYFKKVITFNKLTFSMHASINHTLSCSAVLMVVFNDFSGLFQPKYSYYSVILVGN